MLCPPNVYNSRIIKLDLFSLSFSIFYAINFLFIDDEMIHKVYELCRKYNVSDFKIVITFLISYILTLIIKFIFLSERNIAQIRNEKKLNKANDISENVKRCLVIKDIIFFITGLIFLVFFWLLLSSFGAVFQNTQIITFKNSL